MRQTAMTIIHTVTSSEPPSETDIGRKVEHVEEIARLSRENLQLTEKLIAAETLLANIAEAVGVSPDTNDLFGAVKRRCIRLPERTVGGLRHSTRDRTFGPAGLANALEDMLT